MAIQLLLVFLAYLIGATPTSLWVGRAAYGVDLRTKGSGNLGATNTYRIFGWKAALPVLVVDILKGWLPAALFPAFTSNGAPEWALVYGAAAIAGHVWSFWVGFRGGKGIATSAGVFVALAPWAILIATAIWAVALKTTGYVSLGSIVAALVLPVAVWLTPNRGGSSVTGFALVLALFVIWTHRGNIRRLVRGEERRFGRRGTPVANAPFSGGPPR